MMRAVFLAFSLLLSTTLAGLGEKETYHLSDEALRLWKKFDLIERFFYLGTLNPGESLNGLGFPFDFAIPISPEMEEEEALRLFSLPLDALEEDPRVFSLPLDALEEEVSGLSEVETVYLKALIVNLRTTVWRGGTEGVEKILPVVKSYRKKITPFLKSTPTFASLFRVSGDLSAFIGSFTVFPLAFEFFGEAKKSYRKAVDLDENNGRAIIGLGIFALSTPKEVGGDPYLAIEFFDRAAERDDHPVVQLSSGVWKAYAYAREGRKREALEIIDAVVEEFPFSRWAHQVKKQITDEEALPF